MLVSCIPALWWGGWEGRRICALFVIAGFATYLGATVLKPLVALPDATIVVDILLLVALGQVAMRTNRYWPLWICAFHALSVLSFLAWQIVPNSPRLFKAISAVWSIPQLIVLCIGPVLDFRHASKVFSDAEHRHAK